MQQGFVTPMTLAHASSSRRVRFLKSTTALSMIRLPLLWGAIGAVLLPAVARGEEPFRLPLDYTYAKATDGTSYVSRITILTSINDGQVQRYTFDTGSDQFNTQIDPKTTGVTKTGDPLVYAYGDGRYGYVVQKVSFDTLTYHDPEATTKTVVLPILDGSDYKAAAITDIVYTKDTPLAEGLTLSDHVVTTGLKDGLGNLVKTALHADLGARQRISEGKAADEKGTVWGTFGAGNFLFSGGTGMGLLGGATKSGYIVAANGNSDEKTNGQTPGCSPCVILNLDSALRAQFTSFAPWGTTNSNPAYVSTFPGSGANASTAFEGSYTLGLFAGEGKDPIAEQGVAVLLDTGTPGGGSLTMSKTKFDALQKAGVQFNVDKDGTITMAEIALSAPDGTPVMLSNANVSVGGAATDPVTFVAGQDFFLSQTVMYDLENRTTAYTPYFVSADAFTTGTPAEGEVQLTRITPEMGSAFPQQGPDDKPVTVGYFGAAGVISGEDDLTVTQNAVLRMTNANTYTGATRIDEGGTVELAGIGSIEASSRVIVNGAFDIGDKGNRADEWGVGDAHNDARIRSLAGSGEVQLADRTLVLTAAADTFSGTMTDLDDDKKSHAGKLSVLGGAQVLSGASTFTGLTTIGAGAQLTLARSGTLASPVSVAGLFANAGTVNGGTVVASGGVVAGTGRFAGLVIGAGGVVSPGSDTDALKVTGSFVQKDGSVYLASGRSNGLAVTGTATIEDGAQIELNRGTAGFELGERQTLLTATGGISGRYGDLTGDLVTDTPFIDIALGQEPGEVYLDTSRSGLAFADVAGTANQRATATAAEVLGNGRAIHDEILYLNEAEARSAFDQLSGEIHASIQSALIEESHFVRDAATQRLRAAFGSVGASRAPVYTPGVTRLEAAPATTERGVFWGQVFGAWGRLDGDENAARLDYSTGGFLIGADAQVEDWRLGVLAGYGNSSFDVDDRRSSGSSQNYHLGAYAGAQWGEIALRSGLAYTWHRLETDRRMALGAFSDAPAAAYEANTVQAFGELGYRVDTATASFEPYANLAYVHVKSDGFHEHGGEAALTGAAESMDTTFSTLGVRTSTEVQLGSAATSLSGGIAWRHAFGDVTPLAAMAFAGEPAFGISGAPIAENAALIELGLDMKFSKESAFGLTYQGQIASDAQEHRFNATFTMQF